MLAAKVAADNQKLDDAKAALQWVAENGKNANLVAIARLRLAGVQLDAKAYDDALKTLDAKLPIEFAPLADDRRGDVLLAQGKKEEATKAFTAAWKAMDPTVDYRRFIEGKLTALGQAPAAAAAAASAP